MKSQHFPLLQSAFLAHGSQRSFGQRATRSEPPHRPFVHLPAEHSCAEEQGSQSPFGGDAGELEGVRVGADDGIVEEDGVGIGVREGTGDVVGVRDGMGEDVGVAVKVIEGADDFEGATDGDEVLDGDGFGKHFSSDDDVL